MPDASEREIATIWEEILGVQGVAPEHDFFELGGTSLHAARVVTKTRAAFGVKLSAQTLFEHPTLAGFAAQVGTAAVSEAPPSRWLGN
jgi:acyl carrier protein